MNKEPYSADVVFDFLGERQRFSHQSGNSLTKSVVQAFDMVGLSTFFTDGVMALAGENTGIGRPEIRVADCALTIHRR